MTDAYAFLTAELAHAERHLARIRRIQTHMRESLELAGLDEVAVYEKLAASKAHRQLQRDEVTYQQMWLRVQRHLSRLPQPQSPVDETLAELEMLAQKPAPFRKPPTPGPNQPCSCGSGLKFKKCCGNPLRQHPSPAAQRAA